MLLSTSAKKLGSVKYVKCWPLKVRCLEAQLIVAAAAAAVAWLWCCCCCRRRCSGVEAMRGCGHGMCDPCRQFGQF